YVADNFFLPVTTPAAGALTKSSLHAAGSDAAAIVVPPGIQPARLGGSSFTLPSVANVPPANPGSASPESAAGAASTSAATTTPQISATAALDHLFADLENVLPTGLGDDLDVALLS